VELNSSTHGAAISKSARRSTSQISDFLATTFSDIFDQTLRLALDTLGNCVRGQVDGANESRSGQKGRFDHHHG
jgi:hypothetical protein